MVLSCTDDFDVTWKDPADAALRWGRDRVHLPRPLPPLAQAYGSSLALPVRPGTRTIFLNGYQFMARSPAPPPQTPPGERREPVAGDWESDLIPQIRALLMGIRDRHYESLTAVQLAGELDAIFGDAVTAFQFTMQAGFSAVQRVVDYFAFCERELPPNGLVLAGTLIQGYDNESAGSARGLGELAALAAASSNLAAAARSGDLQRIRVAAGGEEFAQRLHAFLDEYGWRAESWSLIHLPVWAEDPAAVLKFVAGYLDDPESSPLAAMRRAAAQRDQAHANVMSRLSPEKQQELEGLLREARQITKLSEGRAFWQLTATGVLRAPLLALGLKLVQSGVIDEPGDVFFLYLDEVKALAANPKPSQARIAARKADYARWETLDAPASVGASGPPPPPPASVMQTAMRLVLGIGAESSFDGKVIKGSAAARGSVAGRARVIRSLDESGRLQPGEILVCQSTSPAWTPLIAAAAGVVTDTGGILSHSAICAREFAIPCVVGTQIATTSIPDGAFVRVDGEQGTVTIEA